MTNHTNMSLRGSAIAFVALINDLAHASLTINKRWFSFLFATLWRNGTAKKQMHTIMLAEGPEQALMAWQMMLVRVMAVANLLAELEKHLNIEYIQRFAELVPEEHRMLFLNACQWFKTEPLVDWMTNLPPLFSPLYRTGVLLHHDDARNKYMATHAALMVYTGCIKALFCPWSKDATTEGHIDAAVLLLQFDETVADYVSVIATAINDLALQFPNDSILQTICLFTEQHNLRQRPTFASLGTMDTQQYVLDIMTLAKQEHDVSLQNGALMTDFTPRPLMQGMGPGAKTFYSLMTSPIVELTEIMNLISSALVLPMMDAMEWYRELFTPAFMVQEGANMEYFVLDQDQVDVLSWCHTQDDLTPPATVCGKHWAIMPKLVDAHFGSVFGVKLGFIC